MLSVCGYSGVLLACQPGGISVNKPCDPKSSDVEGAEIYGDSTIFIIGLTGFEVNSEIFIT